VIKDRTLFWKYPTIYNVGAQYMEIYTHNWFKYLNEEVRLTEGLRDIGLPEYVVDFIEEAMPKSPEKAKTYAGNGWKKAMTTDNLQNLQFTAVNHLIDQYGDYVQMQDSEEDQVTRLQARTVEPYDMSAIRTTPRQPYDDEMIKRAEQVKFVIQNIKNVLGKPMGTWRKAFKKAVKALSKAGVPSEKVESTQEYFKALLLQEFQNWWYRYDLLFAWLNSEPTNYELIKGEESLRHAYEVAQDDLNNREDPEMVIHQFDDGSYWYNLDVSNCSVEGERMGHCGGDSRGVLVSLRKKKGKRKASSSYITMTWDDETLYQIKGRSNDAPPNEMWDHIDWFIKNMGITSVQESGEHSNDYDGFREMNDYLSSRNRGVSFAGAVDIEAIDEALNEIQRNYDGENSSISAEAQGPEEHGGDGVYVYMSGYASMEIELRWKGFRDKDGFYVPTLAPDDNTPDDSLNPIPINSWGSEAREFEDETGFDAMGWDMPGEEAETEWEIEMKEGSHPPDAEWEMGDKGPMIAVLTVRWSVADQEIIEDEDDATRAFENFSSEMENWDENYEDHYAEVRGKMAQHGYIAKTVYDRDREEMAAYDMDHWKVWSEKAGLEFWFRPHRRSDSLVNSGGDTARIPMEIKMWAHDETRDGHLEALFRKIFGSAPRGRPPRIESDDLNRNMARNLEKLYAEQEASDPDQEQLPFGQEYDAPPVRIVLAKDSRFVIEPTTRYGRSGDVGEGSYPNMPINWRYTLGVDHTASTEEIQTVKDVVKYFNENSDMVELAAMQTIRDAMAGIAAVADATKADVMSGKWPQNAIQQIDNTYGPRAASGSDEWAERAIMIAVWIKENFDQMSEPEKYVAWFKYLKPIKEGYFNFARSSDIEMDDDANIGMPKNWTRDVQDQMKKMKAFAGTVRNYSGVQKGETLAGTLGEPQPVGESVEDQIARIDSLLKEQDVDVRLYRMEIRAKISEDRAKRLKQLQDQLRGIPSVTTLSTIESRDTLHGEEALLVLKFALVGQKSREQFVARELLPLINKVSGVQVDPRKNVGWSLPVEMTAGKKLEESTQLQEWGFGGLGANLGAQRYTSGTELPTPRPSLQSIIDDWAEGGVMAYDVPTDIHDMRYSVMLPIEELTPFTGRYYRGDMNDFQGRYQQFIKTGPNAPVYLAIGMNGRVSITGNEDIVWFAKKSGLKEVPVFLSYQKQV
jgi:hypothetical protein